ncbi:preprotein translocase subunit YajC [Pyruvatibacter sp.]|uniref:preprotein translocase subunit YajC n=1 Tax=Pyruvatibacter sp. TaxID=1981328 RepID=UPI0032EE227F
MLITPAYAQTAGGGTDFLVTIFPFIIVFAIIYLLILRPQQKRIKEHRAMVEAVRRGDTVVTAGGLIGKVTKVVDETEVQVEIAEGTRVRVVRSTLSDVRSKTEPAPKDPPKAANNKADDTDTGTKS